MTAASVLAAEHLPTSFLPDVQPNGHIPLSTPIIPIALPPSEVPAMSHEMNGQRHHAISQPNGHADPWASPYKFQEHRLRRTLEDPSRTPLLLVACGSFSPITFLHLRMFEMVRDHVRMHTNYEVVGGYLSPVSDAYEKPDLASARDRLQMCDIAVRTASDWLTLDSWEAKQKEYSRTAVVLDHFDYEVNKAFNDNHENDKNNNLADQQEGPRRVHVALLAGADLIGTMSTPGVWSESDLEHILGRYGAFIVEREGTDIDKALSHLQRWKDNIHVINQPIRNDVSSTKIRQNLKKDMSVEYLIPGEVITYIRQHGLYRGDSAISSIHRRGNRLGISHSEATSDSEGSHG